MKFINVGYGNMAAAHRLIAVVSPDAAPVRRMVQDARDAGHVIDATCGHKTRAVLVTDSEHVILSPLLPDRHASDSGQPRFLFLRAGSGIHRNRFLSPKRTLRNAGGVG